ncbi:hypothetical protein [Stenotrophomonas bentonitica]
MIFILSLIVTAVLLIGALVATAFAIAGRDARGRALRWWKEFRDSLFGF